LSWTTIGQRVRPKRQGQDQGRPRQGRRRFQAGRRRQGRSGSRQAAERCRRHQGRFSRGQPEGPVRSVESPDPEFRSLFSRIV
jgi:hypothetical protein